MLDWQTWTGTLIALVAAVTGVAVVMFVTQLIAVLLSRRLPWVKDLYGGLRTRLTTVLLLATLWVVCSLTAPRGEGWWPTLSHVFLIAMILSAAWLLSASATFGISRVIAGYGTDDTAPEIRRKRTQLSMVRRLVAVLIAVIAVGAALFTFPEMRAVGTGVLASAGIVSIVAGLAAQSTLGNLIAGIQVAFSDSVRVGDIVVVEGEWGHIGEITLSYVVVNIWDERRLVLPSTYFTTQPFESWTRKTDNVLGTVYMDLDWRIPVDDVRARFQQIVEGSDAWDGRFSSVLVTGSQGGLVTLRFLISAANADDQWDLRCLVREQIVKWLQTEHPYALPTARVLLEQPSAAALASGSEGATEKQE